VLLFEVDAGPPHDGVRRVEGSVGIFVCGRP
jgi:hypothetical protein